MISIPGYTITSQLQDTPKIAICRGRREADDLPVMLKVLRQASPSLEDIARFRREYEITRSLRLDTVVTAYGLVRFEKKLALALEDVGGRALSEIAASRTFTLLEFLALAQRISSILGAIHQQHVIHTRITPSTIRWNIETDQLKLADFGCAARILPPEQFISLPQSLSEGGMAYMSPEQTGRMNRRLDCRTDLYSLGVMLYELLLGVLPFQTIDPLELVHCHLTRSPMPPHEIEPAVPKAVSNILMKLLAKRAEDRYQSAAGLLADLRTCHDQLRFTGRIQYVAVGQHDVPETFHLSQRLYGRTHELETLQTTFHAVAQGHSAVLTVTGQAGTGKSALVNEFQQTVFKHQGYFLTGRCDRSKRDVPYSAIIQAIRLLIQHLLAESEPRRLEWKDRILAAVGEHIRFLREYIPELGTFLDSPLSVSELPAVEAQNRLYFILQRFLRVFSHTPNHPLVIFLDNVQWADSASLRLIQFLLHQPERQWLMIITAYRAHEIPVNHPFQTMLKRFQKHGPDVIELPLTVLSFSSLQHFLVETLRRSAQDLTPLTSLALQKTGGNPLAVTLFLRAMVENGALLFDGETRRWQWHLEQVRSMASTEHVIEWMAARIQKLPAPLCQLFRYAACIGTRFDLRALAATLETSKAEIAPALDEAVRQGFLLPGNEAYRYLQHFEADELTDFAPRIFYEFAHNQLREAVLDLLSLPEHKTIHLAIGRYFLHGATRPTIEGKNAAEVATHFHIGGDLLLSSPEENLSISRVHLLAGQQAKAAADYPTALRYLTQGMRFLPRHAWETNYPLVRDLYQERAEAEYLCGNFEQSKQFSQHLFARARTPLERAAVYTILIRLYTVAMKYDQAIRTGQEALKTLGFDFPSHQLAPCFSQQLNTLEQQWRQTEIPTLLHAPAMTDPITKMLMQLLGTLLPAAFYAAPLVYRILVVNMVSLSLTSGHAPESAHGYAHYAALISLLQGDYRRGDEVGRLAVALSERGNNLAQKGKTLSVLAGHVYPWVKPIHHAHRLEHEAYDATLEAGDPFLAGISLLYRILHFFYEGTGLEQLSADATEFLQFAQSTSNQVVADVMEGYQRVIANLRARTSSKFSFETTDKSEEQFLEQCREHQNKVALSMYYSMKTSAFFLYGNPIEAVRSAMEAEKFIDIVASSFVKVQHTFYYALSLAAMCHKVSEERRQLYIKVIGDAEQQLQTWTTSCPENFQHLLSLVQAEYARITQNPFLAMQRYQQAIATAKRHGFIHHKALAHELAARFYATNQFDEFAELHIKQAYDDYKLWGAERKAAELVETHAQIFSNLPVFSREKSVVSQERATPAGLGLLDVSAVLKALQAFSEKIVFSELLEHILKIVIENAGAQTGWFLLKKQGEWMIEARGVLEQNEVEVLQSVPIGALGSMQRSQIPLSITQHVIQTRAPLVLQNAVQQGQFASDPYIVDHQVQSVLCFPLLNGGQVNGMLYLENNLAAGAFTPQHLEVLNILSAQIVISIENARLYRELHESLTYQIELSERHVELTNAYSRFVPKEFLSLLEKQSIVDVQLGDQIEKEITVMFSDIRGFTPLSEHMTPQQNFHFINSYLSQMSPIIREHNGFIDKFIGDGIMALFPGEADDAVRCSIAMLERLQVYNQGRKRAGYAPIRIGIGLNTGLLMLGTVGDQQRMDGTVISDAVNLASRIEEMTKIYGVSLLISEATYFRLKNPSEYAIRIIDQVQAKGKSEPVTVFEVFNGDPPDIIESKLKTLVLFKEGFKLYHRTKFAEAQALFNEVLDTKPDDQKRQIAEAKELFQEVLHVNPFDKVAQIYAKRCEQFEKVGVLEEWTNVWAWVDSLKKP